MSHILLGQSYFLRFDPKLWNARQPYPPLGTLYAASYLRQNGYEVALFDAMLANSESDWAQALAERKPRFAVLYEDNFNYLSKMCLLRMRQAAWSMIGMARARGCTVIAAGADASDHAEAYLHHGADFVLLGEGEQTLVELLDSLTQKSNRSLAEIAGLAYASHTHGGEAERRIVFNPRRPEMKDLDSLPFPAWDLVDLDRYRSIWLEQHGYFSMNMVTTRGCPFHCNWCAKPIWGQRYHSRSPENVAEEMRWLKEQYQADHIWFADDIFGLKPGWLKRFGELAREAGGLLPFKCLSRADLLTRPGEVDALRQAGAQTVWLGAESGAQAVLDAMDKGIAVEQIRQARGLLKSAGIRACFFLQFGYPGETRREIEKTLQLVRECDPDDIGISVSYPLPGTKFFQSVQIQLGEKQNWQDSSDLAMLYQGTYSTAFYRQLHKVVHHEFRMRKAWQSLSRKQGIFSWLRAAARAAYNSLALPASRLRLNWLGRHPNPLMVLPHLPHEQAAQPSRQDTQ